MNIDTEIRPYRIDIPRPTWTTSTTDCEHTRWPEQPEGTGWSRGVPVDYLRELADYWANGFDWRAQEARLNEMPQFVTRIDGQDIHFLHVRSGKPDALPLVMTHGWPSSPVEFLRVIGPLTDPIPRTPSTWCSRASPATGCPRRSPARVGATSSGWLRPGQS